MASMKIALLGLGTVGSGVLTVLARNQQLIAQRLGKNIEIVAAAVNDVNKPRDLCGFDLELCADPVALAQRVDVDIVLELMGGLEPAKTCIEIALQQGKHVVSANKALLATHGEALLKLARQHQVNLAFEAAVAGGIPIIKALEEGLAANQIQQLCAILNGTSNYILTQMQQQALSFQEALTQAQAKGYAEADPSFDIDGTDIAHKLTILSALAFATPLEHSQVFKEGITNITYQDLCYADELGYHIKPLAIAESEHAGVTLRVHPALIAKSQTLAHVDGVMNAVLVNSDALGTSLYYGAGAGAEATASAVLADVLAIGRATQVASQVTVHNKILSIDEVVSAHYLRLTVADKAGVLADITRILGEHGLA